MRALSVLFYTVLTGVLASCDRQPAPSEHDLKLGLECFERHRASLPPGTQYEGIDTRSKERLAIKIMNGAEVVTIDCE